MTDPNGHNTIYCYDNSGRTLLTQNADGHSSSKAWGQDDLPSTTTTADQSSAGVNTSLSYLAAVVTLLVIGTDVAIVASERSDAHSTG